MNTSLSARCMRAPLLAAGLFLCAAVPAASGQPLYTGVNLSGAEFGNEASWAYGITYIYPTTEEVDYFTGIGMNVFRLPFMWERLQNELNSVFIATELARLDTVVDYATAKGARVILDPHNFGRYYGKVIGTDDVPVEAFRDFWSRLAAHYKDNDKVIFGLMNEPNTMPTELWLSDANAAIDAIRDAGAANLILVPGNAWTGAHSWSQNWYGTPNATVMTGVVDPLDHFAFDVHQYLDSDFSGTHETCVSETIGSEKLASFTDWLQEHGFKGFLGEFAGSANETCLAAVDDLLDYIDDHTDVWLGWTWWSAGPWWGDYIFSIEPEGDQDRPQTAVLKKHLASVSGTEGDPQDASGFALGASFPNPARAETTFRFTLPSPAHVALELYDVLGRRVRVLADGEEQAGRHTVTVDVHGLPSGVYVYTLRSGTHFAASRFVVTR